MEKRQRRSLWKNASGGAYGKTPAAEPFVALCLFAHMFFPALSPDSVDNRITAFE
ncbi:hypothetical protein P6693_004634 [Escherichia coli]|nr:hypothetical protein [Escherichia coli]